jgi:glutamyl-Q tRNA(Asp) synthetase
LAEQINKTSKGYVGRFAPSPTGPLHLGSLVCALASYLHAKQHNGTWLVRIEDIDEPRAQQNLVPGILESLVDHGLEWDAKVVFQSKRHAIYRQYLSQLDKLKRLYACACTRQQIKSRHAYYDGHCRDLSLPLALNSSPRLAIRFLQTHLPLSFVDEHLGQQNILDPMAAEDPVLQRKDGIYAYHLAVVSDDIEQGVSNIVRGYDLINTTPIHLALYKAFNHEPPNYLHIPIAVANNGKFERQKLSKQNLAPAVKKQQAIANMRIALYCLGFDYQQVPKFSTVHQCLAWALEHWSSNMLPKQTEVLVSIKNGVYSAPY